MHVADDGKEALAFIRQEGCYCDVPRPDIVLLDINLPKIDGLEVLKQIKADDKLKVIPVIMLTSSEAEKDITASYAQYANGYITKPVDFDKFLEITQTVEDFWFSVVKLPNAPVYCVDK